MELNLISSGELGLSVAAKLASWIPKVLKADVKISSTYISRLFSKTGPTPFGIIILTSENIQKPWSFLEKDDFRYTGNLSILSVDLSVIPQRFDSIASYNFKQFEFHHVLSKFDAVNQTEFDLNWESLHTEIKSLIALNPPMRDAYLAGKHALDIYSKLGYNNLCVQSCVTEDIPGGFIYKIKVKSSEKMYSITLNQDLVSLSMIDELNQVKQTS